MTNDLLEKLIADKYRIESLYRERDSGDLFQGKHEVLDKPVTVQILPTALSVDARCAKRFVDRSRAASMLSHPNHLNITDFGTDAKGITYAIYEPIDGPTLREAIDGQSPFDERRPLEISRQIAGSLIDAHAKGHVHGGLNPDKIFINSNDTVKVFGFGNDPLNVADDADPRYLSPEQNTEFPVADPRSDVYSLGVMLFEMFSGVVPFDGKSSSEIVAKQNAEPPPPLSAFRRDLHPEIEPIVLSAIATDPERRYPDMAAFAEDLGILSGRIGIPAVSASAMETPKRNIWQTAFVVLAGISILAVALIYATSVRKTDPTTNLVADAGSLPVQPIGPATGAQEESLAKLPNMTDAEIIASASMMNQPPGTLAGGDGYNAWANGGVPPAGAPLNQNIPPLGYVPQGGQVYTIDPNSPSQFMPQDGGVILVPIPANTDPAVKPSPTPRVPAGNTAEQVTPAATPKPMATPPAKNVKPPAGQPTDGKPKPAAKPANTEETPDSESNL